MAVEESVPCAYCGRVTPIEDRACEPWLWPGRGKVTNCKACAGDDVRERISEIEMEAVSRYANDREDLSYGELADIEHADYLDPDEAAELAALRALTEEG